MMTTKDWILLIVPIICNGIIVLLLQKAFEKKQMVLAEKYRYLSNIQQKVDDALGLFTKVAQTTGNDLAQSNWLDQYTSKYCEVYYYYQQNQTLFKPLKKYMDELINTHELLRDTQRIMNEGGNNSKNKLQMEFLFRKTYELLQSIQNVCIQRKI